MTQFAPMMSLCMCVMMLMGMFVCVCTTVPFETCETAGLPWLPVQPCVVSLAVGHETRKNGDESSQIK